MQLQIKKFRVKNSVYKIFLFGLFLGLPATLPANEPSQETEVSLAGSIESEQTENVKSKTVEEYVPEDTELILSYSLQGHATDDVIYAYFYDKMLYLPFSQLANAIGIKYEIKNNVVTAYYQNEQNRVFSINLTDFTAKENSTDIKISEKDYKNIEDTIFFSAELYSKVFEVDIAVNYFSMEMIVDGKKEFPTLIKLNAAKKRKISEYTPQDKSFKDYEFDERLIGMPVLDLQLGKSWGYSNTSKKYNNSDSYALNFSGIAAGLDFNSYISGNSANNHEPTIRFNAGRTFLDEPSNMFNLKTLKLGDISGMNGSYFAKGSAGRGVSVSSFKNLVMSADKTIDITGPLTEGWEVELYWNDMLLGYKQNSINGEYNFPNIPVSYGLNKFKLVFYGPYGEVRTEERRYYSGTSPVAKGEIGYNIAAYQPEKYMFENKENKNSKGDIPVVDSNFYYGLSDYVTLIGGFTYTPDAILPDEAQKFGMLGFQYAVKGSSLQYNLQQNIDTGQLGHHVEWQGDAYVGTVYASYDAYNKIHSPKSYQGDEYLKNKLEFRFSGNTPWRIPYSVSYQTGKKESNNTSYEDITARISKNLARSWYLSIEDSYSVMLKINEIKTSLYHSWSNFTWQTDLSYTNKPKSQFTDLNSQLTYRTDRYTYYTFKYRRDLQSKMDYYSVSGSKVFPFGGLSLSASMDRDKNFSISLNYNMSFTKEPDKIGILTSAKSKLSNSGSVYVRAKDETGAPVEGVTLSANSSSDQTQTDKNGTAFLTDLSAYEKTIINIETENVADFTLKPLFENKKLVLRPGTLKSIELPFTHVGMLEGQIANPTGKRLYGYKVALINDKNEEKAYTFADLDGYFLMENVPYGTYKLVISKDEVSLHVLPDIKIDDFELYLGNINITGSSVSENAVD